jgi:hypothetical protein
MKLYPFFFCCLFLSSIGLAQVSPFRGTDTSQSSADHDWLQIENDFVEVLYPRGWDSEAARAASLIEHFSDQVGDNLGFKKPKKFPLILRPEMALPNGFVTLMPRRSEWFFHQSFNPFVGGLDFFEALAIHEYRHVNQFDFTYRSTNMMGYYLFGEFGISILNAIGIPSWFFEGDAVWAETQYTNAGRGRSPRFWARLKALVLSDQLPTYDEFIGQSYRTILPNHYVFGYFLVARAYRLYGDNFWKIVLDDVMDFAINPYRIYSKFEEASGVEFEKFFADTFQELKERWEKEGDHLAKVDKYPADYTQYRFPLEEEGKLYYLKKELNSFWTLMEEKQGAIVELPVIPGFSKVDLRKGKFAYTQVLPDKRYGYKGSSDLFIYDLKTGLKQRITEGKRLYHPQWSPNGELLLVLKKGVDGDWIISLRNKLGKWLNLTFPLGIPLEATFKSGSSLVVLYQTITGERALGEFDLKTKLAKTLTPLSRNNFFNLRSFKDSVFFEGDYEGRVQVMSLRKQKLSVCSKEPIMASSPNVIRGKLVYAAEVSNGQKLKFSSLKDCRSLKKESFFKFPQDDLGFHQAGPAKKMKTKQKSYEPRAASEFFKGLSPNSWSFIGGRGFQVKLDGNNYLGTFSYSAAVGVNAEEQVPYGSIGFGYNKYPITANIYGLYEERKSNVITAGPEIRWDEKEVGLRLMYPQVWLSDFDQFIFNAGVNGGILQVGEVTGANIEVPNNETLSFYGAELSWQWQRTLTYQDIYPDYGTRLRGFYRKVLSDRRPRFDSDLTFLEGSAFLPGFFENNGIRLRGTFEDQTVGLSNYRHSPVGELATDYVFSRGFTYAYVDRYLKASLDYVFPLWYADWNLWDFHYLRRAYLATFYDHTNYEILGFSGDLQSFGAELFLETNLFRRFPLTYGVRFSNKVDRDPVWDFFLASQFSF